MREGNAAGRSRLGERMGVEGDECCQGVRMRLRAPIFHHQKHKTTNQLARGEGATVVAMGDSCHSGLGLGLALALVLVLVLVLVVGISIHIHIRTKASRITPVVVLAMEEEEREVMEDKEEEEGRWGVRVDGWVEEGR